MRIKPSADASSWMQKIKNQNPIGLKIASANKTILPSDNSMINFSGGLRITNVFNGDENLVIGRTLMKEVELNLIKTDNLSSVFNFNMPFDLSICVANNHSSWSSGYTECYIGKFEFEKPRNISNSNTITIRGHDYMQKFETPAEPFIRSLNYPCSIIDIAKTLCTYVGVEYETLSSEQDYFSDTPRYMTYEESPFDNSELDMSCRELLGYIAEAVGCYATMYSNRLRFKWFHDDYGWTYNVQRNDIFSFSTDDYYPAMKWSAFDGQQWSVMEYTAFYEVIGSKAGYNYDYIRIINNDEEDVEIYTPEQDLGVDYHCISGSRPYVITDNPLLKKRSSDFSSIYDWDDYETRLRINISGRIQRFGYVPPFSVECEGCGLVEAGDYINVEFEDGTYRKVPLFVVRTSWNGGAIFEEYETTGQFYKN